MQKITGQKPLIKEVDKIMQIFKNSGCMIRPHFILTGESGSGKTFIINQLTIKNELNFLEVNAAQLTKEGVSGNSLSKALSPMLQVGNKPTVIFVDEFDKLFIAGNTNDSLAHEPTWNPHVYYRVKPELPAKKLRPFTFDELVDLMETAIVINPTPHSNWKKDVITIVSVKQKDIVPIINSTFPLVYLQSNATFLDGRPFGVFE